jgi:very-short-patch-repair endonuclease
MDFLLLLPANVRVVVEVDGKDHYAEGGRASATKYAAMVSADRELRLADYDVYRFGAVELDGAVGTTRVKEFFEALFRKYKIKEES